MSWKKTTTKILKNGGDVAKAAVQDRTAALRILLIVVGIVVLILMGVGAKWARQQTPTTNETEGAPGNE